MTRIQLHTSSELRSSVVAVDSDVAAASDVTPGPYGSGVSSDADFMPSNAGGAALTPPATTVGPYGGGVSAEAASPLSTGGGGAVAPTEASPGPYGAGVSSDAVAPMTRSEGGVGPYGGGVSADAASAADRHVVTFAYKPHLPRIKCSARGCLASIGAAVYCSRCFPGTAAAMRGRSQL